MRIRISRTGKRRALAILPLVATASALAWPASAGSLLTALAVAASPTATGAPPAAAPSASASTAPSASPTACLVPGSPLCPSPSPTATAKPTAKPTATPTNRPTVRPTAGGGPGPRQPTPNAPTSSAPPSSDNLVGQSAGPPTPPPVPGSRIDFSADPQSPGPGESTLLTITVSGSRGGDRYAVPNVTIDVQLSEKPDDQAQLSATTLTSDVTGSAQTRLTLSRTRGRHVVTATSGGTSAHVTFDTLAGSSASAGRAHHSAGLITTIVPPLVSPNILFAAAALFLVGGFVFPYRNRVLSRFRRPAVTAEPAETGPAPPGEPAAPPGEPEASVSSGRKPRAARRSAAPGG